MNHSYNKVEKIADFNIAVEKTTIQKNAITSLQILKEIQQTLLCKVTQLSKAYFYKKELTLSFYIKFWLHYPSKSNDHHYVMKRYKQTSALRENVTVCLISSHSCTPSHVTIGLLFAINMKLAVGTSP